MPVHQSSACKYATCRKTNSNTPEMSQGCQTSLEKKSETMSEKNANLVKKAKLINTKLINFY